MGNLVATPCVMLSTPVLSLAAMFARLVFLIFPQALLFSTSRILATPEDNTGFGKELASWLDNDNSKKAAAT